jgi:hypothetical protein
MLWTLSMKVRPVLAKASKLIPSKNESSYGVADPGRAKTKRYYFKFYIVVLTPPRRKSRVT